MFARWLQRQWFQRRLTPALLFLRLPLLLPLLPLHALFVLVSGWQRRRVRPQRLPVPVLVVGNLTVGGAGKTPLTLSLAQALQARGWRPGIVSRGYGRGGDGVVAVTATSSAAEVGDEPLLLARRSGVPVYVGRDRVAAAQALLAAQPQLDLILCDDGLQHLRLGRDVELAVFDGRGAGNGWRLPLGPLREPLSRLATVDAVIGNFSGAATALPPGVELPPEAAYFPMRLQPGLFVRLDRPAPAVAAAYFHGRRVHALAGIGDPGRFFATLQGLGIDFVAHPFPDHHAYTVADLSFAGDDILLMTEKDAVKCSALVPGEAWYLPVEAELPPALIELVEEKLRGRQAA